MCSSYFISISHLYWDQPWECARYLLHPKSWALLWTIYHVTKHPNLRVRCLMTVKIWFWFLSIFLRPGFTKRGKGAIFSIKNILNGILSDNPFWRAIGRLHDSLECNLWFIIIFWVAIPLCSKKTLIHRAVEIMCNRSPIPLMIYVLI